MTANREQHELAARAAGLLLLWKMGSCKGGEFEAAFVGDQPWRPKEDDGDALRLAVSCGIAVTPYPIYEWPKHSVVAARRSIESSSTEVIELYGNDPDAATRLAIFGAAVEIGKAMP